MSPKALKLSLYHAMLVQCNTSLAFTVFFFFFSFNVLATDFLLGGDLGGEVATISGKPENVLINFSGVEDTLQIGNWITLVLNIFKFLF